MGTSVLLVASALFQRPIVNLGGAGGSSLLLRPWDVAWVIFLVATAPLLVQRVARDGPAALRPRTSAQRAISLYAGLAVISLVGVALTFGSDGLVQSAIRAGRLVAVIYAAVALSLLATRRLQLVLVAAVVAVAVISGVEALVSFAFDKKQLVSGTEIGITRPGGPFGNFFADGSPDRWWAARAASTTLGFWLSAAVVIAMSVLLVVRPVERRRRALVLGGAAAALAVVLPTLLATSSREAWLGAIAAVALLCVALSRRIGRARLIAAGAVVAVVAAGAAASSQTIRDRITHSFTPGTFSFRSGPQARVGAWKRGAEIAWDRFPVGWGVGGVEEHSSRFGTPTAENAYIQAAVQLGPAGTALVLVLLWSGLTAAMRAVRERPEDVFSVLSLAVFALFAVHGIFGNTFADPTLQVLLVLALTPSFFRAAKGVP
jgi:O-antigen ligase/polysaccharide polymerase Wzy-like membrane protein